MKTIIVTKTKNYNNFNKFRRVNYIILGTSHVDKNR